MRTPPLRERVLVHPPFATLRVSCSHAFEEIRPAAPAARMLQILVRGKRLPPSCGQLCPRTHGVQPISDVHTYLLNEAREDPAWRFAIHEVARSLAAPVLAITDISSESSDEPLPKTAMHSLWEDSCRVYLRRRTQACQNSSSYWATAGDERLRTGRPEHLQRERLPMGDNAVDCYYGQNCRRQGHPEVDNPTKAGASATTRALRSSSTSQRQVGKNKSDGGGQRRPPLLICP